MCAITYLGVQNAGNNTCKFSKVKVRYATSYRLRTNVYPGQIKAKHFVTLVLSNVYFDHT